MSADFSSLAGANVSIHVVGAGGTGSAMIGKLVKLALVASALGQSWGVTVWDGDTVSPANVGRQDFGPADVGRKKADVLVNRVNLSRGLRWRSLPEAFSRHNAQDRYTFFNGITILVGCVDTSASRRELQAVFETLDDCIWVDCGNSKDSGQVVLGARLDGRKIVPSTADLFSEILEDVNDVDATPSCSVADAIARQDPMINEMMAVSAANLLWRVLRFGALDHHGVFVDAAGGVTSPIPVDPDYWRSLGWHEEPAETA